MLAVAVCLLQTPATRAQSIGISPGSLEVNEALRGGEYSRPLTIINQQPEPLAFRLVVQGEAAAWVTLYDGADPSKPVRTVDVPAETDKTLTAKIVIPADAANRQFLAEIALESVAPGSEEEPEESGAAVTTGLALDVVINVTGTQRLAGTVSGVTVGDTEVGRLLRARMDFQNTGNVVVEPEVTLLVAAESGSVSGGNTTKQEPVPVEGSATLKAEWDTSGQQVGSYRALVTVRLAETQIYSESFDVRLVPEGTFSRVGELTSLTLTNTPFPGAVARVAAGFRNTGEIDTRAAFQGEVYRDGTLIDTASSVELFVETGAAVELEVFVPVTVKGKYTVKGAVNYEGKETEPGEITFDVPPDLGGDSLFGRPWWQLMIGFGVVAAAVLFVVDRGRWWKRPGQPSS